MKGRPGVEQKNVPNFIHLQADKIPGYEKFKLDEYIRLVGYIEGKNYKSNE